ncbi:MAG: hypothetical protein ACYCRH_08825 [Acidiferrobacteraceae bacterium]
MLANAGHVHPDFVAALAASIALVALFMLRPRAHRLILLTAQMASRPFKRVGIALRRLGHEMSERNRAVLLAQARTETGEFLEQEFRSVDESVRRDLEGFPELNRTLLAQAVAIEEAHRRSGGVPPPPAEWGHVLSVLTQTQPPGKRAIQRLWRNLRKDAARAQSKALTDYRKACEQRHRLLASLRPSLEQLRVTLGRVDQNLVMLRERASAIDHYMHHYNAIVAREETTERELVSSALVQFLTAVLLTTLVGTGYVAQFWLLTAPFAAGPATGIVATLAFGMLVTGALAGFVMTEALGLSSLTAVFDRMSRNVRRQIALGAGMVSTLLVLIEAASVFWGPATTGALGGWGRGETALCVAVLPVALVFAALPLESLIYGVRIFAGLLSETAIGFLAALSGGAARLIRQGALALIVLYDALIFVPLAISAWRQRGARLREDSAHRRARDTQAADR